MLLLPESTRKDAEANAHTISSHRSLHSAFTVDRNSVFHLIEAASHDQGPVFRSENWG